MQTLTDVNHDWQFGRIDRRPNIKEKAIFTPIGVFFERGHPASPGQWIVVVGYVSDTATYGVPQGLWGQYLA